MGILDWIEEKARKKMRFSQVKILYQNISAAEFLIQACGSAAELPLGAEPLKNLLEIQERTRTLMTEMPDGDMLVDTSSEVLFADNRALKKSYAAVNVDAKAAEPAEAIDFFERFKPEAGWKSFTDADWDALVGGQNKT